MKKHDIDAHHFLEFVHDIDYDFLKENPKLNQQIKKLPGEKLYSQMVLKSTQKSY